MGRYLSSASLRWDSALLPPYIWNISMPLSVASPNVVRGNSNGKTRHNICNSLKGFLHLFEIFEIFETRKGKRKFAIKLRRKKL